MNKCASCAVDIPKKWLFCNGCVTDGYKHSMREKTFLERARKNLLIAYENEEMRKAIIISKEMLNDDPFIKKPHKIDLLYLRS